MEFEFRKDFLKNFYFSVIPELRFQDEFSLDEYMIQGKLAWSPVKFLTLAGTYRVGTEVKKRDNVNYNRIALDAQASQKFNRFEASFRTRYTNYSDFEQDESSHNLRPRVKLEYNIKGNRITPFASYELFHDLTSGEFNKARADVGFTRNVARLHRVGLYYRLQDYFSDRQSIHIVGLEYRLRLR